MAIKFLSGQTISGTLTVSGNVQGATFNGLAINTTGVNNLANQIVRTEANGYVNFGWINSVSGNHTGSITRITASNDAYLRYVTPAQFRTGVTDGFYAPSSTVSGVTSVATGNGLTGGTITSTGTLTMSGSYTGAFSVTGFTTSTTGFGITYVPGATVPMVILANATTYGIFYREATPDHIEFKHNNVVQQSFDGSGNVTMAGDLTVSGGDITLGGTGRIQGVDTVSASTDAANKAYVDAHPGSGGTVTSVAAGNGLAGGTITTTGTLSTVHLPSFDTRSVNPDPEDYANLIRFDFKSNGTNGLSDGGGYNGQMTWRSYGSGSDLSGGQPIRLAYTANGNLWRQMGTSATSWGSWAKFALATGTSSQYIRGDGSIVTFPTISSGTVTSVNYTHQGNAFTVGGVPVTSSGTIAVTMAGSSSQYINGAGNLISFPTIPPDPTGVYLPLAGGTVTGLTNLIAGSKIVVQNGTNGGASRGIFMWTNTDANWGIYMATPGATQNIAGGAAPSGLNGESSHSIRFRIASGSANGFIWENSNNATLMSMNGNSGNLTTGASMRSPIFYDSNNTGYYVDPSSVSNVNQVRTDALSVNTNGSQTTKTGLALYGAAASGEPTYGMMFTGISGSGAFGGVNGDWATYFTMNSTTGRGWIFRDVSTGNVASITNTGWAQFAASVRSPIFYDSNNTAYYGDFASSTWALNTAGSLKIIGGVGSDGDGASSVNQAVRVSMPNGASYSIDSGVTGAFKIRLPVRANNTMWSMKVRIYSYATNQTSEYTIGNYSYSNGGYNSSVSFQGASSMPGRQVRWGNDGTYDCVWIGETNSSWSYPVVSVMDFQGGFRLGNATTWTNNWDISLVTSFGTVQTAYYPSTQVGSVGYATDSFRTPIFYDSNNTAYYGNFASTSNMFQGYYKGKTDGWSLQLGDANTTRIYDDDARASLVINADYYPHLYINANISNGNLNHGAVFSMTGNISGGGFRRWSMGIPNLNPNMLTIGTYDNSDNPHYGCGGDVLGEASWGSKLWLDSSSNLQTNGSMRSPIFYDSNNTGYYVDPASTSQLNVLNCAGTLTVTGAGGVIAPKFTDYNNGSFYLDPSSTGTSLNVAGDVVAYASSDIRFKNNVLPITNALDKINKIGGYTFEWNEKSHKETGKKDIGVIAQEVEEILPEIVDTRDNGYKAVDYSKLTALLIQSVKEQQVIIDNLKSRIETLENN
jgi:hypothetical protein